MIHTVAIVLKANFSLPGYVAIHQLIIECSFLPMRTTYSMHTTLSA